MNTDQEVAEIKQMVKDIHHVVIGSEHDKDSGLLKRVKDLESDVEGLQKFNNKLVWVAIGMTIPAVYGLGEFLSKLLITLK